MKTRGLGAVLLAYSAAAAVGGAFVAGGFSFASVIAQTMNGEADRILAGLRITPVAFLSAFAFFLVGFVVVGIPAWLILSRLGRTERRHAVLLGAGVCFLAGAILMTAGGDPGSAWEPWALAASLTLAGAMAGWTLHRVAFGEPGR